MGAKSLQQQCQDFATMLASLSASLPDLLAQVNKESTTSETPTKKQKTEDKQAFVTAANNGGLWSILKVEFDRLCHPGPRPRERDRRRRVQKPSEPLR